MDDDKLINEIANDIQKKKTEEFNIEYIESPNFNSRFNTKIDTIVIHYTDTNRINSIISWFKDKISKVSAHYVIGRDGRIVQMVKDENNAWHAGASYFKGRYNVNKFSIGIELVGTKDSGFTDKQYKACAYICSLLIDKFNIPLGNIIGYSDIAGVLISDPGSLWDWEKFHIYLTEESGHSIVNNEPELEDDKNNEGLYSPDHFMESGKDVEPNSIIEKIMSIISDLLRLIRRSK